MSAGLTAAILFNETGIHAANAINLVDSVPWPIITSAGLPVQTIRPPGLGVDATVAGAGYQLTPLPTRFVTNVASVFWYGIPLSTSGAHQPLFIGTSSISPTIGYGIAREATATTSLYVLWNNGTDRSLIIPSAWTNNVPVTLGMTIDGTTVIGYAAGTNVGSTTTNVGTISYGGTRYAVAFSREGATNQGIASYSSCAYMWNRALTAGEMAWLDKDPFAPVRSAGSLVGVPYVASSGTASQQHAAPWWPFQAG